MGFKSYMDSAGRFITEAEAEMRVEDMKRMRLQLKERIARDKVQMEERERVLRGKAENSDGHRSRSAKLENVDDFEAQMEQAVQAEKQVKKKKKNKKAKEIEKGVVIIVDDDEEDEEVQVNVAAAIDTKDADIITAAQ